MTDLLFVYGTLRSEFGNSYARRLRAEGSLIGRAAVAGSIFRIGPYPGYRPQPEGEVVGEIYRLANPGPTLAALDEYEGPDFERVVVATLTGASAFIYQFTAQPPPAARIGSGDFCRP